MAERADRGTTLLHYQMLPEKRLAELMADLFGVRLTTATIAAMGRACAVRFQGFVTAVRDLVAAAAVKHLDETGLRIGGKTQWLHIASTILLTFYRDRPDEARAAACSKLEVQIEELADALERCRKTALTSKAAVGLGGILVAATTLGVVTFDPMVMVAGLAALLGGVVVFGSNTSTANQLSESMRSAEAQRAALIGQLDIRLVEDAPANQHS